MLQYDPRYSSPSLPLPVYSNSVFSDSVHSSYHHSSEGHNNSVFEGTDIEHLITIFFLFPVLLESSTRQPDSVSLSSKYGGASNTRDQRHDAFEEDDVHENSLDDDDDQLVTENTQNYVRIN